MTTSLHQRYSHLEQVDREIALLRERHHALMLAVQDVEARMRMLQDTKGDLIDQLEHV
jgi:hypothetical protein